MRAEVHGFCLSVKVGLGIASNDFFFSGILTLLHCYRRNEIQLLPPSQNVRTLKGLTLNLKSLGTTSA
jgi:hypothetical protein